MVGAGQREDLLSQDIAFAVRYLFNESEFLERFQYIGTCGSVHSKAVGNFRKRNFSPPVHGQI